MCMHMHTHTHNWTDADRLQIFTSIKHSVQIIYWLETPYKNDLSPHALFSHNLCIFNIPSIASLALQALLRANPPSLNQTQTNRCDWGSGTSSEFEQDFFIVCSHVPHGQQQFDVRPKPFTIKTDWSKSNETRQASLERVES